MSLFRVWPLESSVKQCRGVNAVRNRPNAQRNGVVSALQYVAGIATHWLDSVERLVWNWKVWRIHVAMHKQMTVAPLGDTPQNNPLAILAAIVLDHDDGKLLVVKM